MWALGDVGAPAAGDSREQRYVERANDDEAPSSSGSPLTWNENNRLDTVTTPAGITGYVYDADGNQLVRVDPDATTLYLAGQDLVRDNTSGILTGTRYYTHNGMTVAMRVGGSNPRYVQSDQHGTGQVTATTPGFAVTRRAFDPYGNPIGAGQGLWPDNRGFLNMPHNPVTGLTDIGARKYDPATGTFVSVDPILDTDNPQQWNPYAYSNNNPVTYSDPSGLYCDSCNYYAANPEVKGDKNTTAGNTLGCSYSTNGHCGPVGSGSSYEEQKLLGEWYSGTGDGSNQPIIYGHRLPTAEEMQRGFSVTSPIMMAPGETYQEAVTHWATYLCNSGIAANSPGFCEWSYTVGNEKADGWDFLWTAVDAASLAFPEGKAAKGAKAANEAVDLGRALDMALCSFTGDTGVLMADGTRKAIKDVEVGDQVLAGDPEGGTRSSREVTALAVHQDTVLDLVVEGGSRVTTTEDHPFWNATDRRWERADQLDPGDTLLASDGSLVRVVGLDPASTRAATAHNLSVAAVHTYYVLVSDTPVLVHNCGAARKWADKANFSDPKTMSKKYDAHASDFGIHGNRNNQTLAAFKQSMLGHMTADGTRIYRFNYRGQGTAVGFIDPSSMKMVMLHADSGKFWTAYRLGGNQFSDIVNKGYLW